MGDKTYEYVEDGVVALEKKTVSGNSASSTTNQLASWSSYACELSVSVDLTLIPMHRKTPLFFRAFPKCIKIHTYNIRSNTHRWRRFRAPPPPSNQLQATGKYCSTNNYNVHLSSELSNLPGRGDKRDREPCT